MTAFIIRFLKRFAVLVPGLVIAYLSIFNIFPWLNDHLPVVFAVLITYVAAAYVLIPALIRLVRIFIRAKHLPFYCLTPDGFASDPLNIGLIGTRQQLVEAMTISGWHGTDKLGLRSGIKAIISTVYGLNYLTAPISSLYLFGRKQDIAFQIPIEGQAGSRHHVRFWATDFSSGTLFGVRSIDWQQRQADIGDKRLLWVGAASRDVGVTFIRHNAQLTHLVDPDTNSERELIVSQLRTAKAARTYRTIKLEKPYKLTNLRGWYRYLQADGRLKVMELTPNPDAAAGIAPPAR